jgi:hypothetical protein
VSPRWARDHRSLSVPRTDKLPQFVHHGDTAGVDVFDSQEHAYTQQVTAKGYDTMTGVGTPDGAAFIAGLRYAAR